MNYRHAYHAGNFGDVLKHVILVLTLRHLLQKEAPIALLDSHAGIGRYDLAGAESGKTGEFRDGVLKVLAARPAPPPLGPYIDILRRANGGARGSGITTYPGSPEIAALLLRPQDRLLLNELHPEDFAALRRAYRRDARVQLHNLDGFQAVKALLPPKERRGVVLIDPAYEVPDDLARMVEALVAGHRRFATGVFLLWYPIKGLKPIRRMQADLKQSGIRRILAADLLIQSTDDNERLNGAGMVIVNPPWQLDEELRRVLPWLARTLGRDRAAAGSVSWVVPE